LKIYGGTEEYIEQLIPTSIPISKIKVDFFVVFIGFLEKHPIFLIFGCNY
jgi:hypothetical protein